MITTMITTTTITMMITMTITMTITTTLTPVRDGTKVTFTAENVPAGISAADHKTGMESTLKNLANLLE